MPNKVKKPRRTLGISLAVILAVLFYTVIPLLQVGFTFHIREFSRANEINVGASFDPIGGLALGISSVTTFDLLGRAIPALINVVIAVIAWRGRPPVARVILTIAVVVLPLWYGLLAYLQLRDDQLFGVLSSDALETILRNSYFIISILATLYTVWYMNRAPARAYYRGYYLEGEGEGFPSPSEVS